MRVIGRPPTWEGPARANRPDLAEPLGRRCARRARCARGSRRPAVAGCSRPTSRLPAPARRSTAAGRAAGRARRGSRGSRPTPAAPRPVDRLVGEVLGGRVVRCAHRQREGGQLRDPDGPVELHDVGQQGADPDPVRGVGVRADRVLDRVRGGCAGGAEGEPARGGPEHHRLARGHVARDRPGPLQAAGDQTSPHEGVGVGRARSCRRRRARWPAPSSPGGAPR